MRIHHLPMVGAALLCASPAHAQGGTVQLPLEVYQGLTGSERPAAARWALGDASAQVTVTEGDRGATAHVVVEVSARVLDADRWALIPLVPGSVAVTSATGGGAAIHLTPTPAGLAWATRGEGTTPLRLEYQVEATRYGAGWALSLPLPSAPSTRLSADLPGTGIGVSVIPSTGATVTEAGERTRVAASVPAVAGAQLSWQTPERGGHTLSRASYRGQLAGGVVRWVVDLGVELSGDAAAQVPLLPTEVALETLQVDGADAAIDVAGDRFAVTLRGRGRHEIRATFQTEVASEGGLPGVALRIPRVPVSRFELTLPGDKEVRVIPATGVERASGRGTTVATFHVAMTDHVSLTWPEAVPEDLAVEVEARANASLYHVAHAEEGVLHVQGIVEVEVTRGTVRQLELDVPAGVQVDEVSGGDSVHVNDWRLRDGVMTVFLDRAVAGSARLEVEYERLLDTGTEAFEVPLLTARDVHRQRGMVALLSSRELTLTPRTHDGLTRVGENQLPAALRDAIAMTVAHTFRYVEPPPPLTAVTTAREREQGRFDAQVDTLISLGDAITSGVAMVDVHVKSGGLSSLSLALPSGVSFLDLSAPSLRQHRVEETDDGPVVRVEFTQEMEGVFRVEVQYERILVDGEDELPVPSLHVRGADVEQGRIAVEALAAVQVDPTVTQQLSPVDVTELPQQLVLRTTNPILHAYKYVHAAPAPSLGLRITRHREIETQDATIDSAQYRTLYTRDGFAVTTATFIVRNQRKQFLRVGLPRGSEVWSTRVHGEAETPAIASDSSDDAPAVLINIIHSTDGFPVELVYATRVPALGAFGRVSGSLPRPDVVVTRSRWTVLLPQGASYGEPSSDMDLVVDGAIASAADLALPAHGARDLRLEVPDEGVRFVFEKLYAGQSGQDVGFSIPYSSSWGARLTAGLGLLGALLLWLGVLGLLAGRLRALAAPPSAIPLSTYRSSTDAATPDRVGRRAAAALAALAALGAGLLAFTCGYLSASAAPAAWLSAVIATLVAAAVVRPRLAAAIAARREDEAPAPPADSTPTAEVIDLVDGAE